MKKQNIFIIAIALAAFLVTSCETSVFYVDGSGHVITETLELDEFTGIHMTGAEDVDISYGPVQSVEVRGDDNIIPRIQTSVVNGIWHIELERGNYHNYELKYYITVPRINRISNDGAARVTMNDFVNQGNLDIIIDGAGDIQLNRLENTEEVYVTIEGAGKVAFEGEMPSLDYLDILISGTGSFTGYPAVARECRVEIEGAAKCDVSVEERLDVIIEGAGTVRYKGSPQVYQEISGLGAVKSVDDR